MGLKKFEFIVWPKQGAPARPIIEATSFGEAIRIAKAQFSDARSVNFVREVR